MPSLTSKTIASLRKRGVRNTLIKGIHYFTGKTLEDRFTDVYYANGWDGTESVSGAGSTLEHTFNLRRQLPILFEKFAIRSIFDAPCGDFNWMQHVIRDCGNNNIGYIGGDIVAPMIDKLNARYSAPSTSFIHVDLTKGPFPSVDLMFCRDCIQHLSFAHTRLVLQNFARSGSRYLLASTNSNPETKVPNQDITSGACRPTDLFSDPYCLPKEVSFMIEENSSAQMCLWTREQIANAVYHR
jgi:hypothetical protein